MNFSDFIATTLKQKVSEDFRTSHLRGPAKTIAEAITKLIRNDIKGEPTGGGCQAFLTPTSRRSQGFYVPKEVVLVLLFDGGSLAPYMNPDYGYTKGFDAMQGLLYRMGYWTERENNVEAHVYKR